MMSQENASQRGLRVVVLGFHWSGKTSMINTLLDQTGQEYREKTDSCVKREGEVCRRKCICIDTPGWWRDYRLSDTADFIKQKIVLSVNECLPGPHAFLLIIDTNVPFTEKNRRSVEEHVGLFGERVWEHTIVVLTREEYREGESIVQHIESEGQALKWVVEKCGNRCHVFNINSSESCNENKENKNKLLEQIDGMVAKYGDSSFELDEKILREVEEKRNTYQERAKMRQQNVMDQREMLHKYGVIPSLSELRILLLGWLIAGKTSAKNTIIGQVDHVKKKRTCKSERMSGEVAGRQVSVVDTPGWWKYLPAEYTAEWVKTELQRGLTLDSKSPHAILLAVPVDTTFLEEQRKTTEENMKMYGEQIWRHTMVLFTCGDRLGDTSIEEHIESEGEPLQWLVEKCGNRYHVISWYDKEKEIMELLKNIEEMVAGNSLFMSEPEAQEPVSKKTTGNLMEVPNEMVHFLDQTWQRMDRELEEKIAAIFSEMPSTLKGSMDNPRVKFRDDHSSSEDTPEEIHSDEGTSPPSPPESKSPKKSDINAATGFEDQEQTSEKLADLMERMKEMFERMKEMLEKEWGRREFGVTQRFQRQLKQLRESGSEADMHDLNESYRKVIRWMHNQSSGIGSDLPEDDLHTEGMDV